MKKTLFLISLLACGYIIYAQTPNTIVNDNSLWATLSYGVGYDDVRHEEIACCVETQYIYFEGDSTVASVSYKKVFSCNDRLRENIKYEGLIREQEQKTYFIPVNSEKEYLLYDFSLKKGDTFKYIKPHVVPEYEYPVSLYVKHVDFVKINGVQLKRIQLTWDSDPNASVCAAWIETIGSSNGLFEPGNVLNPDGWRVLLCCSQNHELVYKNPAYSECYYDNPDDVVFNLGDVVFMQTEAVTTNDCGIFPNPVDDIINISCLNNAISRIEILDNLGRRIFSQTGDKPIDISTFPKGVYLLKMHDTNKQVSTFKFVKK